MKKRKALKIISLIIATALFLSILSFGLVFFIVLNPKNNFNKLFNVTLDKTIEILSKGSIDESTTSINKGNIKLDTNIEKYESLVGYEIKYDIENDRKENKTIIDLQLGDEEENIESSFYYEPNLLYVDFSYIISDMIKIQLDEYGYEKDPNKKEINYNKESTNYILSVIKNSFINNINEKNYHNSIDEHHVKSTYNIDNKELERLLDLIVNDLKKDEKAMQMLIEDFLTDGKDLDNYKVNILNYFNDKYEYLEINMYNSFLFNLDKITINTKSLNIELLLDETNHLVIKSNNREILNASFNSQMIQAKLNKKSKVIETDLKIDTSKDELNLDGLITYKENENDYIKLDVSVSTLLNEKINTYDTTQAKSFNQFTSKDLKSLYKIIDLVNNRIESILGNNSHNINLKLK